jgi:hypothetical protein
MRCRLRGGGWRRLHTCCWSADLQIASVALHRDGRHGGYALQPGFSYAVRTIASARLVETPGLL